MELQDTCLCIYLSLARHMTQLHFNSLKGLYRIDHSFTSRGTWQSVTKGYCSARAAQHLDGFFHLP